MGDEKVSQTSLVSAKLETQATPAMKKVESKPTPTKTNLTTAATTAQATSSPVKDVPTVSSAKPKMEPVQKEITIAAPASTETLDTTITSTISKVPLGTEEKQPAEAELSASTVTAKAGILKTEVSKAKTMQDGEEAVKTTLGVTEISKTKTDLPQVGSEADVFAPTVPVTASEAVLTPHATVEPASIQAVPESETKPEIKLTETTKSLPQADMQPWLQEPQPILEAVIEANTKEVAAKPVDNIIDDTSPIKEQAVLTKDITFKVRVGL